MYSRRLSLIVTLLTASLTFLSGCATTQGADNENDPLEGFNRGVYSFNDALDRAILKPVATGYTNVLPQPIRTGVSNFFNNFSYPLVILNDLLQGKFGQALSDTGRFVVNTTVGILGIFDPATPLGLPAHDEDFGQTLAVWGVGEGAYIVLPFFGPSTVRDTGGLVVDIYTDPLTWGTEGDTRLALRATRVVDKRSQLLSAGRILDEAALDPYSFTREAYRQRRNSEINDGNVPESNLLQIE
jgi:phospholipid-binding lipoprotein MlaA